MLDLHDASAWGIRRSMTPESKPRICVIGTSNAVYQNGYTKPIREYQGFAYAQIHALGHVDSSFFPYWNSAIDLSSFDICILDFSSNDGAYIASGEYSAEVAREAISYALAQVASAGCMPVLLLLPSQHWPADGGAYARIISDIANELTLPMFDVYALLRQDYPDRDYRELFMDEMHLTLDVARHVGERLCDSVAVFWPVWRNLAPVRQKHRAGYMHELLLQNQAGSDGLMVVHRQTSLIAMKEKVIPAGQTLSIMVAPDSEALGTFIDLAHTECKFTIEGESARSYDLDASIQEYRGPDLSVAIMPSRPLAALNGVIRIAVGDAVVDVPDPALALVAVGLRRPATISWPSRLSFGIDLSGSPRLGQIVDYLDFRADDERLNISGWSAGEHHGRWAVGERAQISLPKDLGFSAAFVVLIPFLYGDSLPSQMIEFGNRKNEWKDINRLGYQFLRIDSFVQGEDGRPMIDLRLPDAVSPTDVTGAEDRRLLSIAILGLFLMD